MIQTLKAPTREDFEQMAHENDLSISKIVVNRIKETIESEESIVHIFDVLIEDEEQILEIKLDKSRFHEALEKNLLIFEKHEYYEGCIQIKDLINKFYNE